MRKHLCATVILIAVFAGCGPGAISQSDSLLLRKLWYDIMWNSNAYANLKILCKDIGPRLSGSDNAARAVTATANMLKAAGADTVFLQPCMVPRWVRGEKEEVVVRTSQNRMLNACVLGMSVSTPKEGITAQVIEVENFDALEKLPANQVSGKIVFFNYPMRPELMTNAYGDAVRYRSGGPVAAAKKGAIAVVIRSVTHALDQFPHTGSTRYDSTVKKIPAFAISTVDAHWLSKELATQPALSMYLRSDCRTEADVMSYNVIGEIRGSELPDEILLAAGHLDSWDLGEGAHDDGAGCVQAIEMIRAFKALGIRPRRTVRAVLYMNEENGLRGGNAYAEAAKKQGEKHLFAIESDAGGFGVETIGFSGSAEQLAKVRGWQSLLRPYGIYEILNGGGGADIGPLRSQGVAVAGLNPNSQRYFDVHHAPSDVLEAVNKRELDMGAFGMAAICLLISEYGL